jgi:prolyl oligopeptidase
MRASLVVSFVPLTLLAAPLTAQRGASASPPTRRAVVVDTIHGVAIPDSYRWLESQSSGEVRGWIAAQRTHADAVIGRTPSRDSIAERVRALMGEPTAGPPRKAGAWEYFTLRRRGEEVASIRRRRASETPRPVDPDSSYELVVDPLAIRRDGTTSVNVEGFSRDGSLMLYSVRDGGPDEVSIRVRDLSRRVDLPDSLPWALYAGVQFDRDARGITYVHRSRTVGPRLKHHRMGTPVSSDSVMFGEGYAPTAFLNVSTVDEGKRRLITVGHGWKRNDVLLQDAATGAVTPIAQNVEAHFAPQWIDGAIWMRTDLDAPKGRLVVVDPAHPEQSAWRTVLPEQEDVLDGFSVMDGKLYATYLHDVASRIRIFTKNGASAGEIPVPEHAQATLRPLGRGAALLTITSFAQPPVTERLDLATLARTPWEASHVPFDPASVEVRQVWYTSKDGTRAPMYVMYRKGAHLSPDTPALLTGYGGFALSLEPRFDARAALWVERGGIFAQATLRGGNEYGEAWHKAGMLANKEHVFEDFQSAAQMLVDSGWTSPAHLAIRGVSNGGLLMGSAVTQRPDLFRAAFIGRPDLDMLRFDTFRTANNMPALLEYGDAGKAEEFAVLRTFSPYQMVRDSVRYPAIMFDAGYWDTRVPPWQARKMAARLQAASASGLPIIYYEDPRSGHAGGRPWSAGVDMAAREIEFLWRMTAGTSGPAQ